MYRIHNITYFISNRLLFNKVSITFNKGDRIGLIGANGAGKTTLLRVMAGQAEPEEGRCEWPSATRIGYLQQESLEIKRNQTVREMVMDAFKEANSLEDRLKALSAQLERMDNYDSDRYAALVQELEEVQSRYELAGGHKREAKAEDALKGLGFSSVQLDEPLKTFSGGWQMRALLAKLLLEEPDILLLDEPTNHLDITSIEWLERYLPSFPGAVWLVSHDQMFLNRMVTHIAALQNRQISLYKGNYDTFEEKYQEQLILRRQAYENQQKELEQAEKFINRFRAKATKARQVQSKIKQLEKVERLEAPDETEASIEFRFPDPPQSGVTVMSFSNLTKTYRSDRSEPVHVFTEKQDIQIERGDKIALIGANGAGKSTLARIINGTEPFDGERIPGHNLSMTFFAQHLADVLESDRTVMEEMEMSATSLEARSRIRGILGAFLFSGDDVFKKTGVLSGGERSRLALAKSLLEPANLLILDEPTNHLDIQSRKVLLRALEQYKGTVVAVSHDRFFLSGFANKVWRVADGRVYEYPGDYAYYEWKVKQQQENGNVTPDSGNVLNSGKDKKKGAISSGPKSKEQKKAEALLRKEFGQKLRPLREQLDRVEKRISGLEEKKALLEEKLADPEFYSGNEAGNVVREHGEIQQELEGLWVEWEEASTALEAVEQEYDHMLKVRM
ncbi:ABC-F family ATP-binding cassette domain-containing protein [Balneolaceae bacterium ANBcel3]|nr:ABC-F family ATP-binding cassette domain-containing protein [Balneolaceae bacterium ANBcel3]